MRPINRGSKPRVKGKAITFKKYQEARGSLIKRIGGFCSYCEMKLDASLAVEHIRPKKPRGAATILTEHALSWTNMLLSCTNCNALKGDTHVVLDDYFWPDRDNTFRAFEYDRSGVVKANAQLSGQLLTRAEQTIKLTGLDRCPAVNVTASDRRWINRRDTWNKAVKVEVRYQKAKSKGPDDEKNMLDLIEDMVEGYWSVWMTVFKNHPEVLRRLIAIHPGTSKDCFDAQGKPTARPGGAI